MNPTRLLVAVDDSEVSRRVAAYVAHLVTGCRDCRVRLVHILPPVPPELLEHGGAGDAETERQLEERMHVEREGWIERAREDANRMFDSVRQILVDGGVPDEIIEIETFVDRIEILSEVDEVASDLLEVARSEDFGTIVIGRTHHSRWRELFRRHVSDELVRTAGEVTVWVVG